MLTAPSIDSRGVLGAQPGPWLESQQEKTGLAPSDPPTIMVVDDEMYVLEVTGRMLREEGYAVIQAASGEEAISRLREAGRVDLVLADVAMPGMDGLKLADSLGEFSPPQRIVLMSGFAGVISKIGVRGAPLPVLAKPFTASQLAQRVREALGQ